MVGRPSSGTVFFATARSFMFEYRSFQKLGGYTAESFRHRSLWLPCVWQLLLLILRYTALGTYIQSVGINKKASRIAGYQFRKELSSCATQSAVFAPVLAGIGGNLPESIQQILTTSDLNMELDAILAVALGGNSLGGGKFSSYRFHYRCIYDPGDHDNTVCAGCFHRTGTGIQGGHCYHHRCDPGDLRLRII